MVKDVYEINNKNELTQQLKECYQNGKEIYPKQSAKIFHKLGQLYCKQTSDMIKLIQSAALYNAAISRSPDNVHVIKNDLKKLCYQVLNLAKAKNLNADLIAASKQIKQKVEQMRFKVEKKLNSLKNKEKFIKLYKTRKKHRVTQNKIYKKLSKKNS